MLRELGWNAWFDRQLSIEDAGTDGIARVVAHFGSRIDLIGEAGELTIPAQLANAVDELVVGDWVLLHPENRRVLKRFERQSFIARKAAGTEVKLQGVVANVDTVLIVSSCNADFNLSRIERYLALSLQADVEPVVVLTKSDLHEATGELRKQCEQLYPGLVVVPLDARDPDAVKQLWPWCRTGNTVTLLGSSGVGKSTLASSLGAGELKVGSIREQDAKGRHTTTTRSLFRLPAGGVLIDTPGMRELQLTDCEAGVSDLFDDVEEIAQRCRFRDCRHEQDAGCALQAAIANGELDQRRYASYMKLMAEQAHHGRSLQERRERDRELGKFYRTVQAANRKRRGKQ